MEMKKPAPATSALMEKFSTLVDPRIERTKKHSMTDLLVISICGFICGPDNWVELEEFGELKKDWFKEFLPAAQRHSIARHLRAILRSARP